MVDRITVEDITTEVATNQVRQIAMVDIILRVSHITEEDINLVVSHITISQVDHITVEDINLVVSHITISQVVHITVEDIILMVNHTTINQVGHITVEDIILMVNHTVIEDTDLVIAIVIIEEGFNLKVASIIKELKVQIIIVRQRQLVHLKPSQQILYRLLNGSLLVHGDDQHSFLGKQEVH